MVPLCLCSPTLWSTTKVTKTVAMDKFVRSLPAEECKAVGMKGTQIPREVTSALGYVERGPL